LIGEKTKGRPNGKKKVPLFGRKKRSRGKSLRLKESSKKKMMISKGRGTFEKEMREKSSPNRALGGKGHREFQ